MPCMGRIRVHNSSRMRSVMVVEICLTLKRGGDTVRPMKSLLAVCRIVDYFLNESMDRKEVVSRIVLAFFDVFLCSRHERKLGNNRNGLSNSLPGRLALRFADCRVQ